MKKLLINFMLFLALLPATQAQAGPWTVGPVSHSYADSHILGDGSDIQGGLAPAYAYEAADIASNFTVSDWLVSGTAPSFLPPPGESKARFECNASHTSFDDPIIAPGIKGGSSHEHTFLGNTLADYSSTYQSLRTTGRSTCGGGLLNRTAYWEPSMKKVMPSGAIVTLKPILLTSYYICTNSDMATYGNCSRWPRGIKMIGGFNMADPTNSVAANAVAQANASSTGHTYRESEDARYRRNGFDGWSCLVPTSGNGSIATSPIAGADTQPYLRNSDGTPTLDCAPNSGVQATLRSEDCWDGVNLDSPNGRGHVYYSIFDATLNRYACKDGDYVIPQFVAKVSFWTTGQLDYTNWYAASDRMPGMTQFRNGESMHFDLIPAWDYGTAANPGVMLRFFQHCLGVTTKMGGTTLAGDSHTCGTGTIDANTRVKQVDPSPDGLGPDPIIDISPPQTGALRYFPLPAGTKGRVVLHGHH